MQSLWSRAGQARHCGCRACSDVINGAGRRATTAVRRRKPTFAEIFTACYSSMFASAAIVDAIRKEDRRQELDRQLAEARHDLAVLQQHTCEPPGSTDSAAVELDTTRVTINQMDSLYKSIRSICRDRPFMKEIKNPVEPSASDMVESLRRDYYGCPDAASVHALGQVDYEALERGVVAEESNESIPRRELRTDRHLAATTKNSAGLIKALLREADENDMSSSSPTLQDVRDLLVDLKFPSYKLPGINWTESKALMASLHRSLRSVIAADNVSLKEKIAKVCCNLLISPYPPDVHTFNTLIVAFDKAGLYNFSEAVAFSFYYRQTFKPTPLTYVALLNHYKESGLVGRFIHTMSVLAGGDMAVGAKLQRKHVDQVSSDPKLWLWAADTKRRSVHGEWVYEHVPLHRGLSETLVHGLIHFKLFDAATAFLVSCMRAGVTLGTRVVRHLLDGLVLDLDWKAAVRLIRELTTSDGLWRSMLEGADAETISCFIDRLYVLLDMSGIYRPGRPPSQPILAQRGISCPKLYSFLEAMEDMRPTTGTTSVSGPAGSRMLRYDPMSASKSRLLQIESLWKESVTARSTAMSLERKLIRVRLTPDLDRSMAMHIASAALDQSLQLSQEFLRAVGGSEFLTGAPGDGSTAEDPSRSDRHLVRRGQSSWSYDSGVWVHKALRRHVIAHSQPVGSRTDWLPRKQSSRGLAWLDEWESTGGKTKYSEWRPRLPSESVYWEDRP